mmetsp:Transcript_25000/g.69739  ORF Transcript_25000/g.69739 Transcript_25000/m.69739 type:complete len:80 (-) Transcript_25000:398-637(-)
MEGNGRPTAGQHPALVQFSFELAQENRGKPAFEEQWQAWSQTECRLMAVLEDMKCKVRNQVHLERIAREKSEESLLRSV